MLAACLGFLVAFGFILFQVPIAIALAFAGFGGYVLLNGFTPALSMSCNTGCAITTSVKI